MASRLLIREVRTVELTWWSSEARTWHRLHSWVRTGTYNYRVEVPVWPENCPRPEVK
jgi:hypothetical protein